MLLRPQITNIVFLSYKSITLHVFTHIKAGTTRITAEIAGVTSGICLISDPEYWHHSWNSTNVYAW